MTFLTSFKEFKKFEICSCERLISCWNSFPFDWHFGSVTKVKTRPQCWKKMKISTRRHYCWSKNTTFIFMHFFCSNEWTSPIFLRNFSLLEATSDSTLYSSTTSTNLNETGLPIQTDNQNLSFAFRNVQPLMNLGNPTPILSQLNLNRIPATPIQTFLPNLPTFSNQPQTLAPAMNEQLRGTHNNTTINSLVNLTATQNPNPIAPFHITVQPAEYQIVGNQREKSQKIKSYFSEKRNKFLSSFSNFDFSLFFFSHLNKFVSKQSKVRSPYSRSLLDGVHFI